MIELTSILVPTDFSDCSGKALQYGCALGEKFEADLHLLHVSYQPVPNIHVPAMPSPSTDRCVSGLAPAVAEALKTTIAEWEQQRRLVRVTLQGTPFVEIIRYARQHAVDLIVMGTHGRSAVPQMLLGSVAEKVVRKAPCPVLIVRHDEHEFVLP